MTVWKHFALADRIVSCERYRLRGLAVVDKDVPTEGAGFAIEGGHAASTFTPGVKPYWVDRLRATRAEDGFAVDGRKKRLKQSSTCRSMKSLSNGDTPT